MLRLSMMDYGLFPLLPKGGDGIMFTYIRIEK
jgi:hypothetical protein